MSDEYLFYIQSPEWKTKRQVALYRAGYRCERCGSTFNLDVHHKTYIHFMHELSSELQVLCRSCHEIADEERHEMIEEERWNKRLDAWGTKVYGEQWDIYPGYDFVEEKFSEWLDKKGIYD